MLEGGPALEALSVRHTPGQSTPVPVPPILPVEGYTSGVAQASDKLHVGVLAKDGLLAHGLILYSQVIRHIRVTV